MVATVEDQLRKEIINSLMSNYYLNKGKIEKKFSLNFDQYFKNELSNLLTFKNNNLLILNKKEIFVTPLGVYAIRHIASVFDQYRQSDELTKFQKEFNLDYASSKIPRTLALLVYKYASYNTISIMEYVKINKYKFGIHSMFNYHCNK